MESEKHKLHQSEIFLNKINLKITQNLIKELNINDYSIKITDGKFSNKKLMLQEVLTK